MKNILRLLCFSFLFISFLPGQTLLINGTVRDKDTESPLLGVNVFSGETGTTTNESGQFQISIPTGSELTFSHIGYKTKMLTAREDMKILLEKTILKGEEVFVNATRAIAGVSPVSFSNLTPKEIETRFTVEDVPMVLASEPGVWAYGESGNGTGYSYVSIRGFDQSRIAVMLDNVPLNDNESHQVYWVDHGDILSDAKEVQIQRGIGNSLYGSAAFGGSINISTRIASEEREVGILAGSGSFNTSKYQVRYASGQDLGEDLSLSLRTSLIESDGYREAHHSVQRGMFLGLEHRTSKMTNQFRALVGYENTQLMWDGIYISDIEDRVKRRAGVKAYTDDFLQQIYSLNTTIPLNKTLHFRNVSYLVLGKGYYEVFKSGRDFYSYNLDVNNQYTDDQEFAMTTDLLRRKWIDNNYYGIVPTLTWRKGVLRADIGGEFRFYTGDHFGEVTDFSDPNLSAAIGEGWHRYYNYIGKKNSLTGFAHFVWNPEDAPFVVMADFQTQIHRWTLDQEKIGHAQGHQLSADWDFLNPRIGMVWHFGDSLFAFVNYGKAQKEPADNQIIEADDVWSEPVLASAEVIHDWEMGLEFTFQKGFGRLNFYNINYLNEQLKNIDIEQEGEYDYFSADSTTHTGVEWEFTHSFNSKWSFGANGAIQINTFTNGKNLPNIPATLFNLTIDYIPRKNIILFAHVKSTGQMWIDKENREEGVIDPFTLVDLGARIQWRNLSIMAKVNNAFDTLYSTYGYGYEWDGYHAYYWPGATRNAFMNISYTF